MEKTSASYKVIKVFNNNVLYVFEDNEEKILFGKGIGFGKRTGDIVISKDISLSKIFIIANKPGN